MNDDNIQIGPGNPHGTYNPEHYADVPGKTTQELADETAALRRRIKKNLAILNEHVFDPARECHAVERLYQDLRRVTLLLIRVLRDDNITKQEKEELRKVAYQVLLDHGFDEE